MFRPPDRAYSAVIQVPAVHQGICAPKKPPAVPSNAKERGYGNVNHDATLKLQIPRGTTPPLCRTPADRNASKYIDTEGLAKEARDRVGGRLPGALGGKSTLHLPVYYPDPNTATRYVAYPENIRPTFTELARLLQCFITRDFQKDLLYPPTFPTVGELNKASTLLKIEGKAWTSIQYKKPEHMLEMLWKCREKFNAPKYSSQQQSLQSQLKNVMGLGYSVNRAMGTLTFDVDKWNINCYRIQRCGVSNETGSILNLVKTPIQVIPTFYKNFWHRRATRRCRHRL